MSLLQQLLHHVPQADSDPSKPLIGKVEISVNLELAPFIVSSSFGEPLIIAPGRANGSVMGVARFAFFELDEDPLWPLIALICSTGAELDWPNYLERELDSVAVSTARDHLAYSDLEMTHVVAHSDCELDFGEDVKVLRSNAAPSDTIVFFAEPEFVGSFVTAGRNVGFIVHNLWRGIYVIHVG